MKATSGQSLISRFRGKAGKGRLHEALLRQQIVSGDASLASDLARAGTLADYSEGQELIVQGGSDSDLFLILSGQVRISINKRTVATRTATSHVGEMALIDTTASLDSHVSFLT